MLSSLASFLYMSGSKNESVSLKTSSVSNHAYGHLVLVYCSQAMLSWVYGSLSFFLPMARAYKFLPMVKIIRLLACLFFR